MFQSDWLLKYVHEIRALKSRVSKISAEKFFIGSNPNLLPIHTHSSVQAFSNRSNSRSKTDFFKFGSNIFRSILSFDFDRYIASFYCPDPFLSFERILKVFLSSLEANFRVIDFELWHQRAAS